MKQTFNNEPFSPIDLHFARMMENLSGRNSPELFAAAKVLSSQTRQGHICFEVGNQFPLCGVVGRPGEFKPLILDEKGRLYLYRYWEYQERLAEAIRTRIQSPLSFSRINDQEGDPLDLTLLKDGFKYFFPSTEPTDWQKVSAFAALTTKFCVISGGPGTGKTTTVAKILALLIEQAKGEKIRIALTAPTGKAAARLQEAIIHEKKKFGRQTPDAIPETASTLHRLLGGMPDPPFFRYDSKNKISVDVVVVDESSMVDLAMMSRLVQAMPSTARLILLGDKDQLASVEAGAVFGDICDAGNIDVFSEPFINSFRSLTGDIIPVPSNTENTPKICDCMVQLQKNYRFGKNSGIRKISDSVNTGNTDNELENIWNSQYTDIRWKNLPDPASLNRELKDTVIDGFEGYLRIHNLSELFDAFERFRILCTLRHGPYGVNTINALVEDILEEKKLIHKGRWYRGRPVLITANNYRLNLFNGDIGIALPDPGAGGEMRVFFMGSDGSIKKFHPLRLPEHETAFAMTVHKSQGSEFDKVLLLLPDREMPILTRELIYTGITRAKQQVEIWGNKAVFLQAVSRRIQRASGLRDALKLYGCVPPSTQ